MNAGIELSERGLVPDPLIRWGIRRLLKRRLRGENTDDGLEARKEALVDALRGSPVALAPDAANEQHYEVPPAFFQAVLGKRLKYSACYWPPGVDTLDAAEDAMLELTCERAEIENGQDVLELGCGWGSLSLWIAERYPKCRVTAVSNSPPQRRFIEARAKIKNLSNLEVVTADMNAFAAGKKFDRVVSVEMFEHMRNYETLLKRIAGWLKPGGKLFVHVFSHRTLAYPFESEGDDNWMGRYFFTGGLMPSHDLLRRFNRDMKVVRDWLIDGTHYQKTAEAWLAHLDRRSETARRALGGTYGPRETARWVRRWRMFFLACAELFGYRGGSEWGVSHYLFEHA